MSLQFVRVALRVASVVDMTEQRLSSLNALVVDDTPSNRKMLQRLLKNNGVFSDYACDGQEAVSIIAEGSKDYDVIFMDNTMPIMNGIDATKQLRLNGFKNTIVGVTANSKLNSFLNCFGTNNVFSSDARRC